MELGLPQGGHTTARPTTGVEVVVGVEAGADAGCGSAVAKVLDPMYVCRMGEEGRREGGRGEGRGGLFQTSSNYLCSSTSSIPKQSASQRSMNNQQSINNPCTTNPTMKNQTNKPIINHQRVVTQQ